MARGKPKHGLPEAIRGPMVGHLLVVENRFTNISSSINSRFLND